MTPTLCFLGFLNTVFFFSIKVEMFLIVNFPNSILMRLLSHLTVELAQLSNFLGSSRASNSYKNVFILGEYVQNPPDIQLVRIQALGNSWSLRILQECFFFWGKNSYQRKNSKTSNLFRFLGLRKCYAFLVWYLVLEQSYQKSGTQLTPRAGGDRD